jgi:hypothetical protein
MQVKRGQERSMYTRGKFATYNVIQVFTTIRQMPCLFGAFDRHGKLKLESTSSRAARELARCDVAASAKMGRTQAICNSNHQSCRSW